MDPRAAPTSFEDFLKQQIESNPDFADVYEETRIEGDLALALAHRREECGLTQRALAEKSGIKQPMIARIERAGQTPTTTTLWRLLTALDAVVEMGPSGVTVRPATPQPVSLEKWRRDAQAVRWDPSAGRRAASAASLPILQGNTSTAPVREDLLAGIEPGIAPPANPRRAVPDLEYAEQSSVTPQEDRWAS